MTRHPTFSRRVALRGLSALALLGVLIIALRKNQVMPLLLLMRNRSE